MQAKILNDRYKIIEEIGRGGMAIVYAAEDTLLERRVALKMLRSEYKSDAEFTRKFRQEARAVAKLSHPNVVSIYDIVVDEERIYLVMEIVEGENLKDLIKRRTKLSPAEALEIAKQIASALSVAHANQIVHCDIKPHNIILDKELEVKVTDFGIARAVNNSTIQMTETVVGSAHYFSPEQAKGGEIKAHSDIYSLGVVLYEMTTGELPFRGESPISVALKHIQQTPLEPKEINRELTEAVNDLILKAIAKDPAARFQNAVEMRHQITYCLKNLKNDKNKKLNKNKKDFKPDETKVMNKKDFPFLKKTKSKNKKTASLSAGKINSESIKKAKADLLNNEYHKQTKAKSKLNNKESLKDEIIKDSKKTKQNKNKFKRPLIITASILLFFLVSIGAVNFLFNQYTNVPVVQVPDIEGKSLAEAKKMAAETGLDLVENNARVFSEDFKVNQIISQQPKAGTRIKQSRSLKITVSKGAELIEIPDLIGQSLRKALIELNNLALNSGDIQYIFRLSEEPGTVINQIPTAGAEVDKGSEVTLFVSRGERNISVKMPDLSGLSQKQAFNLIRENGLNIGQVKVENSNRFAEGNVISQSVKAGEYLPKGIAVDFVISKGLVAAKPKNLHSNRISINVNSASQKEVKIVVEDKNGQDKVYQAVHQPGDNIVRDIQSQGQTKIKIYFDDQLIKTEEFGS
ncbi:MAG: Stk1 family PASTA domain-containing Ser/Thr kinase [Bacillota bacterium]